MINMAFKMTNIILCTMFYTFFYKSKHTRDYEKIKVIFWRHTFNKFSQF